MTAAFSQIDQKMIEAKLWVAMDCHPLAGLSLSAKARKQDRKREQKRNQVSLASDKFFDVMNGDNPHNLARKRYRELWDLLANCYLSYFLNML